MHFFKEFQQTNEYPIVALIEALYIKLYWNTVNSKLVDAILVQDRTEESRISTFISDNNEGSLRFI